MLTMASFVLFSISHSCHNFTSHISAVQSFASLVETTEEAHIAVQQASILPISGVTNTEENKTGWALRRSDRSLPLNPEVKKEVEKLVRIQLDGGRRAEAREIEKQLRELKLNDGSYLFSLKKCITESQIKSQISRILTEEKKRKEALEKLNKEDEKEQVSFLIETFHHVSH